MYRRFDLSIISALLAIVLAIVQFTSDGGYWVSGIFHLFFALAFYLDFKDKKNLSDEIVKLRKEKNSQTEKK